DDLDALTRLLRPAGAGIHTVSTGVASQLALQQEIYGTKGDRTEIDARWRATIESLASARAVVLGVPSDVGAGFTRGANFGPQEIRRTLLQKAPETYRQAVDLGDVLVVPQLLSDEMLSADQLRRTRAAVYGDPDIALAASPLTKAEDALRIVRRLAPRARPLILGGDHSVGWPGFAAVAAGREHEIGILHFDAHTDLLAERLGVRYCFATWAYHANELLGRGGKLVQVGLRISGKTRAHWEETLDVRQYWMEEMRSRPLGAIADEIVERFRSRGVRGVYISNDIDGTDPTFAGATGTPEPGGLRPDEVVGLIEAVGAAFPVWGSDVVEVAPPLAHGNRAEPERTLETAASYAALQLQQMLRESSTGESNTGTQ
ncbi:MAG: arginase family protein, partial [Myxococcota bacterium]